jgi:hypothetical protein
MKKNRLNRMLKRAKVKFTERTGKRLRWRKPKVQR